jgi:hypothetical protein
MDLLHPVLSLVRFFFDRYETRAIWHHVLMERVESTFAKAPADGSAFAEASAEPQIYVKIPSQTVISPKNNRMN